MIDPQARFQVGYTISAISHSDALKLSELGFVVPWDASSYNQYIYIPEHLVKDTAQIVKSVCQNIQLYKTKGLYVTGEELQKMLDKIVVSNQFSVGDIVNHSTYYGLPLEVISVTDTHATLKHPLRGQDLVVELPMCELTYSDEPIVDFTKSEYLWNRNSVLVECNSLEQGPLSVLTSTLQALYQLKLKYLDHNIVLLNPCEAIATIASLMGIVTLESTKYRCQYSFNISNDTIVDYTFDELPAPHSQDDYLDFLELVSSGFVDAFHGQHNIQTLLSLIKETYYV